MSLLFYLKKLFGTDSEDDAKRFRDDIAKNDEEEKSFAKEMDNSRKEVEKFSADRNKSSVELESSRKTIEEAATAEREASEYLKEQALAEHAREQRRQQASFESRTKLADIERRIAEATRGVAASGKFLMGLASEQREKLNSRHTPTFGGVGGSHVGGAGVGWAAPPVVPQLV